MSGLESSRSRRKPVRPDRMARNCSWRFVRRGDCLGAYPVPALFWGHEHGVALADGDLQSRRGDRSHGMPSASTTVSSWPSMLKLSGARMPMLIRRTR